MQTGKTDQTVQVSLSGTLSHDANHYNIFFWWEGGRGGRGDASDCTVHMVNHGSRLLSAHLCWYCLALF